MKHEFEFIHYIKKSFGLRAIGDDCAVLPKDKYSDLVVTADLLVENVDFRLEWTNPEFLGHKALAVSLSDIAAMGGKPVWALLTIGVPEALWQSNFIKRFYEGWTDLAAKYTVELVGGDISRSPERMVIDSIVGGEVEKGKAVLRSGATAGDRIFVSGDLGGAAGGLRLLEKGETINTTDEWKKRLIERQLRPSPRIEIGRCLFENGLSSALIDLSDGLSSDIHHICEASGVGAKLEASLIPVDEDLKKLADQDECLTLALNGGEDFELLFTVPESKSSLITSDLGMCVGVVTDRPGVVELVDGDQSFSLRPSGYTHF